MRRQTALAAGLLILGLTQPAAHVLRVDWLRAVGAMTVASPLPLVFTDVGGFEDFASAFALRYLPAGAGSEWVQVTLSAEHFARLGGPFNRRGPYAAALAYAPVMPEEAWRAIVRHGFCRSGPLAAALGETRPIERLELAITTRTRGRDDRWTFTLPCR